MKEKKKKKDDDDNEEEDLSDSEAELEIENGYKYIERVGVSNVFFCICIMGGCSFNEWHPINFIFMNRSSVKNAAN